jgi:hypothetical protein
MKCVIIFVVVYTSVRQGSKPVTRSQRDYFGKGLHIIFPKKLLHANEFLNEMFCNFLKKYLNFPQCIKKKSLLNKYENLKVCRFFTYSMLHLEK